MTSAARAGSTVGCVLLIFPAPAVSVSSPAARPELMTTLPLVPAAALWMCPMLIAVPAGQPVMSVSNSAFAAVMVPLPEHDASALAIAGTSFELLRSAVKTNLSCGVGAGVGVGVAATVGDAVGATAAVPQALSTSTPAARPARRRID